MKRGKLLSIDQMKYRLLAKQANQRAVRLERYLANNPDAPGTGLNLYNYYLSYAYGTPEQGRKIKRFPENPEKLSDQQLKEYTIMLSNFLDTELSKVSATKKYKKRYDQYVKDKTSGKDVKQVEQDLKNILSKNVLSAKKTGAELKVLDGKKILSPDEYFNQLGRMYRKKLTKVMDYRDAMKILLDVQNVSKEEVKNLIDKTAEELERNEKLTYREIKKRFTDLKTKNRKRRKK